MRTTHACALAVIAAYASVATVSGGSCDAPIQLSTATALLDVMKQLNAKIDTANNLIRQSITKADDNIKVATAMQSSINTIKTNSAFDGSTFLSWKQQNVWSSSQGQLKIGNPDHLGIKHNSFTASALVKRTGNDNNGDVSIFGSNKMHLIVRNKKYYLGFYGNDCGSQERSIIGRTDHVVFVYDQAHLRQSIYVNGKEVVNCRGKGTYGHGNDIVLGAWGGTNSNKWAGEIRDARIYRKAFSTADINMMFPPGYEYRGWLQSPGVLSQFPVHIGAPDTLGIKGQSFTASALVKRTTGGNPHDFTIFGSSKLHLVVRNNKYYCGFYANDCDSGYTNVVGRTDRVTFKYDSSKKTQSIYINGNFVKSCTGKGTFNDNSMVDLGQWAGGRKWEGEISEGVIYRKIFSDAEMKKMFSGAPNKDTYSWKQTAGKLTSFPQTIGLSGEVGIHSSSFTASALVKRTGKGGGDYTVFGSAKLHLVVRAQKFYLGFYGNDCGGSVVSKTDGTEQRVVYMYNAKTKVQSMYVDGKPAGSCTGKKDFTYENSLWLGAWGNANANKWQGEISEAVIYLKTFPADELAVMFPAP